MPLPWQVTAGSCQALADATEIEKKRMEKTASKSVGNPTQN